MTRVALVCCVKLKRATPSPARDLYISALFRGMREYAELWEAVVAQVIAQKLALGERFDLPPRRGA